MMSDEAAMSPDDQIRVHWAAGRQSYESALLLLETEQTKHPSISTMLSAVRQGDFDADLRSLRDSSIAEGLAACLREAQQQRVCAIAIAQSLLADDLQRRAKQFDAPDPAELISQTWSKAFFRFYTWSSRGNFSAWIRKIFKNNLIDQQRQQARPSGRPVSDPDCDSSYTMPLLDKGTTTLSQELMIAAFQDSLEGDRRKIWDEWIRQLSSDRNNEQAYAEVARILGKTVAAVKSTILRVQQEFKEIVGLDLSDVIVLWIGRLRFAGQHAIVATGVTLDDNMKIYAMRASEQLGTRAFLRALRALSESGLANHHRVFVVIDDSPGLKEAVLSSLGRRAEIQLCIHCVEQRIAEVVPEPLRSRYWRAIRRGHVPDLPALLDLDLQLCFTVRMLGVPRAMRDELSRVRFFADVHGPAASEEISSAFGRLRQRKSLERRQVALARLSSMLGNIE
jgi:DNA-directed RNA polymerase specialized sigma24 family protein